MAEEKKVEMAPTPCNHVWHFIEKATHVPSGKVTYTFHCVLCLDVITKTQK